MDEEPEQHSVTNLERAMGPAKGEEALVWWPMKESDLDDAISLAFDGSLEALELERIAASETENVVWDSDGAMVLVP
jgi:hypothetical protein